VKEIQYYCGYYRGRLDFRHVVNKHMVHFFGNIHKTNNVVVKRCFSNFKRGDKCVCVCVCVCVFVCVQNTTRRKRHEHNSRCELDNKSS